MRKARYVPRRGDVIRLGSDPQIGYEQARQRPGLVLSRDRILEHVWDYDYGGASNVVDVYVGYLRRKLEQPFGKPLIRTVRGVGYSLEPA